MKINQNLEFYYHCNKSKIHQESCAILDKLSQDLKNQLTKEFNRQIINKIGVLKSNFIDITLDSLSQIAKEEYYLPNQIIHSNSQKMEASLIFVISGLVEVCRNQDKDLDTKKIVEASINKGEIIGLIDLFTGMNEYSLIKSSDYTQILRISNEDMIKVIREQPKDFENFCFIRDKLLMYQQYSYVNLKCQICNKSTHLIQECPFVHLQRQSMLSKIGLTKSEDQQRKVYVRKKIKNNFYIIDINDQFFQILYQELQLEQYEIKISEQKLLKYSRDLSYSDKEDYEDSEDNTSSMYNKISQNINNDEDAQQQSLKKSMDQIKYNSSNILQVNRDKRCSIQYNLEDIQETSLEVKQLSSDNCIKSNEKFKSQSSNKKVDILFDAVKPDSNQKMSLQDSQKYITNQKFSSKIQSLCPSNYSKDVFICDIDDYHKKFQKRKEIPKSQMMSRRSFRYSIFQKVNQFAFQLNFDDKDSFNPWQFEKLQDYRYYFRNGNSNFKIQKYTKYQNKKQKKNKKIQNVKIDLQHILFKKTESQEVTS